MASATIAAIQTRKVFDVEVNKRPNSAFELPLKLGQPLDIGVASDIQAEAGRDESSVQEIDSLVSGHQLGSCPESMDVKIRSGMENIRRAAYIYSSPLRIIKAIPSARCHFG